MTTTGTLTASQQRNLNRLTEVGGEARYGDTWPTGLNQATLRNLTTKGLVERIPVTDGGGYRIPTTR